MKNSVGRVYVHGSRLYEIAKEDSDVDLYYDIGNSNILYNIILIGYIKIKPNVI